MTRAVSSLLVLWDSIKLLCLFYAHVGSFFCTRIQPTSRVRHTLRVLPSPPRRAAHLRYFSLATRRRGHVKLRTNITPSVTAPKPDTKTRRIKLPIKIYKRTTHIYDARHFVSSLLEQRWWPRAPPHISSLVATFRAHHARVLWPDILRSAQLITLLIARPISGAPRDRAKSTIPVPSVALNIMA